MCKGTVFEFWQQPGPQHQYQEVTQAPFDAMGKGMGCDPQDQKDVKIIAPEQPVPCSEGAETGMCKGDHGSKYIQSGITSTRLVNLFLPALPHNLYWLAF